MDFIDGLPKAMGKEVVFVVVDSPNKAAHFMPLKHPYTAIDVVQIFMDTVGKMLHMCVESWVLAEESGTKVITTNYWSFRNGEAKLFEKIDNPNCFSSSNSNGFVLGYSGGASYCSLLLILPTDRRAVR